MSKSLKIDSKFLCLNGKFFDFKKTALWIFSCNKCILVRLWVKLFVSKGWIQTEIAVHTLYFSVNLINFRTLIIPSKTYNKVPIQQRAPILHKNLPPSLVAWITTPNDDFKASSHLFAPPNLINMTTMTRHHT